MKKVFNFYSSVLGVIIVIIAANASYISKSEVACATSSSNTVVVSDLNGATKSENEKGNSRDASMLGTASRTRVQGAGENPDASWTTKFFCDVKLSDLALIDLTFGLMLATLWLGYYTMQLWQSGDRAASQAEMSARAAMSSATAAKRSVSQTEVAVRPYVFARITEDNLSELLHFYTLEWDGPIDFSIRYELGNEGRTPAIVLSIAHAIRSSRGQPDWNDCEKEDVLPIDRVLAVSRWSHPIQCVARGGLPSGDAESIRRGEQSLWFFGYVEFKDAFGSLTRSRHIWCYNRRTRGRFVLVDFRQEPVR